MFKKYAYFLFYWIVKRTVGYTWKTSACFQTNSKVLKSDTELKEQFSNLEALPFFQKIKLDTYHLRFLLNVNIDLGIPTSPWNHLTFNLMHQLRTKFWTSEV